MTRTGGGLEKGTGGELECACTMGWCGSCVAGGTESMMVCDVLVSVQLGRHNCCVAAVVAVARAVAPRRSRRVLCANCVALDASGRLQHTAVIAIQCTAYLSLEWVQLLLHHTTQSMFMLVPAAAEVIRASHLPTPTAQSCLRTHAHQIHRFWLGLGRICPPQNRLFCPSANVASCTLESSYTCSIIHLSTSKLFISSTRSTSKTHLRAPEPLRANPIRSSISRSIRRTSC